MYLTDDPPLNPDAPTARRWLREELSKPEYQEHKSILQRVLDWLADRLTGSVGGTGIPWWVIAGGLALLLIALVTVAWRRYRPRIKPVAISDSPHAAIFDVDSTGDAQDYRALAEAALSAHPDAAVLAAYRGLVARAYEAGLVELRPATTVGDIDEELGRTRPELRDELRSAGSVFASVRYGTHPASESQARAILHLDDVLARSIASSHTDKPEASSARPRGSR